MMGVFAKREQNMITKKFKEKMDNAKSKGKRIDSPTATSDDISNIFYKHYPKYQKGELDES